MASRAQEDPAESALDALQALHPRAGAAARLARAVATYLQPVGRRQRKAVARTVEAALLERLSEGVKNMPAAQVTILAQQMRRRGANVSAILVKAVDLVTAESPAESTRAARGAPREVQPDWMAAWLSAAQDCSDEDKATLWARVLAREAAKPGAFSLRLIDRLRTLSREEAEAFRALCGLVVVETTRRPSLGTFVPLLQVREAPSYDELLQRWDVSFSVVEASAAAGLLLSVEPVHGTVHPRDTFRLLGGESVLQVPGLSGFAASAWKLSPEGAQLAGIAFAGHPRGYDSAVRSWLCQHGW